MPPLTDAQTKVISPPDVPEPQFADDVRNQSKPQFTLNIEKGSALHEEESEAEAFMRIKKRIWSQMVPSKTRYMAKIQEIHEAYEGIMRAAVNDGTAKTVFPLVFMFVDTKMSYIMSSKPRAVFDHDLERPKVPFLEDAYEYFTTDVDDGIDLDSVDYIWHWYCELYGWSIKRIWHEVDTQVYYEPQVRRDETGNIQYSEDGYAALDYERKVLRKGKVKQRVYDPDRVAVDPSPSVKFLYQARDIVFFEDMSYDEWVQQYKNNPLYKNTQYVFPGQYFLQIPQNLYSTMDANGQTQLMQASLGLDTDRVRVEEYYNIDRCEYYVTFNGIPCLHIPNPTPYNMLPAADLHDRLRPQTFYSKGEGELTEAIIAIYQKLMNSKSRRAQLAASPVVLTDTPSGISPKSFKVYPGAHWRGMKGRAEVLNLAGVDSGESTEYLQELRQLAKSVTGYDFERFIDKPDPTAIQQEARDAALQIRIDKDVQRYESSHVRSMDLTIANIQLYMTIPELANIAQMTPEEADQLKDYDKVDENTYRKYPKIKTRGRRYIEALDSGGDEQALNLIPDKTAKKGEDGYIFARPEFLRTKGKVKVRAISNRKQSKNRQIRLGNLMQLWNIAVGLPPKNIDDIQAAQSQEQQGGQAAPTPTPTHYFDMEKLLERIVDAAGEDAKELLAGDADENKGVAQQMMQEIMQMRHTIMPTADDMKADPMQQQMAGGLSARNFQSANRIPSQTNAQPIAQ